MSEHPVQQPISEIDTFIDADHEAAGFKVGRNNVTRIEACTKSGLHANIPYVRVWAGDHCVAEFCQHNIVGVYFAEAETSQDLTALDREAQRCKALDIVNIVDGNCTTCEKSEADCLCLPF